MLNHKFSNLYWMTMGERIKRARTAAGLTQVELAKRVGVSKGAVSQWEADDVKNLRLPNLFAMADATGFSARWIGTGEGPEKPEQAPLTPQGFDLQISELSSNELAALLRLAAEQIAP